MIYYVEMSVCTLLSVALKGFFTVLSQLFSMWKIVRNEHNVTPRDKTWHIIWLPCFVFFKFYSGRLGCKVLRVTTTWTYVLQVPCQFHCLFWTRQVYNIAAYLWIMHVQQCTSATNLIELSHSKRLIVIWCTRNTLSVLSISTDGRRKPSASSLWEVGYFSP